ILSVQLTGIPLAIASQGYSVAIGAGVGAGLGVLGALKRKGKIAAFYPGDEMQMTLSEPLTLPGFNPDLLPKAPICGQLKNFILLIHQAQFRKDPYDSHSRLLTINLSMQNHTLSEYSWFDLAVVSDHNQRFYPTLGGDLSFWQKKVAPNSQQDASITFSVDN